MEYNILYDKPVTNNIINSDTTHLGTLIYNLTSDIKNNNCSYIKHPTKLLLSLEKLRNIVGMHKLKESIAQQTAFLMTKMKNGNSSLKMLNTCLYGPPGVGKTTIGTTMAEIWKHLGILQVNVDKHTTIINKFENYDVNILIIICAWGYVLLNKLYQDVMKPLYQTYGYFVFLFVCIALLFFVLLVSYYQDMEPLNEEHAITIANRNDFVDIYLGGTGPRTRRFIEANRGKVIFLDEAYNMINGPTDSYGNEAINTITQYMSEHPDEVVFIFAGYEQKLKDTIFKAQPGLERRCMWHFTCEKYTGKELYSILLLQLKKEGIEILPRDGNRVCRYIEKHVEDFKNMGGDMERVTFYLQLILATKGNNYATYTDLKKAIQELRENTLKETPKTDFNKLFGI